MNVNQLECKSHYSGLLNSLSQHYMSSFLARYKVTYSHSLQLHCKKLPEAVQTDLRKLHLRLASTVFQLYHSVSHYILIQLSNELFAKHYVQLDIDTHTCKVEG